MGTERCTVGQKAVVGLLLAFLSFPGRAVGQVDCTAILNEIISLPQGPGVVERAMQLQNVYRRNCEGARTFPVFPSSPLPTFSPPNPLDSPPPSRTNAFEQAVINELEKLGGQFMSIPSLPEGARLSGIQDQWSADQNQSVRAISPPPGFVDPFANFGITAPAQTAGRKNQSASPPQNGADINPFTGEATLQPQRPPSRPTPEYSSEPTGSYSACARASTFGSAAPEYCEMGGWIYFRNGNVLKSH